MTCGKRAAIGRGQVRSADRLRIRRRCSANWPTRCLSSSVPASGFMRRAATSERSGCELSWRRARLGKACSRVHASSSPSVSCSSSGFASASRRSRFSRRSVSTLVWLRSTIRRTSSSSACCDASDTPAGTGPLAGLGSTVTGADPVAHSPSGRPSAARSPSAAGRSDSAPVEGCGAHKQRDPRLDLERMQFAVDHELYRERVRAALVMCGLGRNLFKRHAAPRRAITAAGSIVAGGRALERSRGSS
jgi:hypothetical protein